MQVNTKYGAPNMVQRFIIGSCSKETLQFSSVQLFSHVRLFATPWTAAYQASLSITNSWSLPKLMSIGLRDFTFTFHFHALKKEMATHSSVLAWRIPGTKEPDRLPSMGSHRVGHDWSNLAAAAAAQLLWTEPFCLLKIHMLKSNP